MECRWTEGLLPCQRHGASRRPDSASACGSYGMSKSSVWGCRRASRSLSLDRLERRARRVGSHSPSCRAARRRARLKPCRADASPRTPGARKMNDTMLQAIVDIPGEDIRRGVSRVSPDHPLARSHPQAFVPSKAYPLPGAPPAICARRSAALSPDGRGAGLAMSAASSAPGCARLKGRIGSARAARYIGAMRAPRIASGGFSGRRPGGCLIRSASPSSAPPPSMRSAACLPRSSGPESERIDQLWDGRAPWHKS